MNDPTMADRNEAERGREDFPMPRYRIGEVVYYATTCESSADHPCPDCLGAREWEVRTPAGSTFILACQRCSNRWLITGVPSLRYLQYKPLVEKRTIGSIQIDTAKSTWGDRSIVHYMATETGVGGGTVYAEEKLHPTREGAEAAAVVLAAAQNATVAAKEPTRIADGKFFASLEFRDAAIEAAKRESDRLRRKLEDALDLGGDSDDAGASR